MRKKILVCDDDTGILELIKTILQEEGFLVKVINNGKGIKEQIKQYKPDLILLDIWMPGLNGTEVIKLLKTDPETVNIAIILISALNETEEIAIKAGANDYLSKPFNINDLLAKVRRYI